jgi:DNA primase
LVLRRTKTEGHYDRFRGRIIFPIFTPTGKVVAFGGRTIIDQEPKYLNSPDTPIYTKGKLLYGWNFTKDAIREQREIILVEGYTDFLALLQAGIPNAAASLGTSLTSEQVMQASRFESRVIVSYDADAAGIKASLRAISLCFEQGVEIRVLTLPKGYDPDSYIRKYGPKEFINKIQESTSGIDFLIEYAGGKKKLSPEQKNRVARYIVNEIIKIPNSIIQSEYLKKLSEELNLKEDVLRSMIKTRSKEVDKEVVQTVFLNAEKRLLQILFNDSNIVPTVLEAMKKEDFTGLQSESIFLILSDFINNRVDFNILNLREKIDKNLFSSLAKILQEEEQGPSVEEAMECVRALRQFALENECLGLKHEISRLEKENEMKKALIVMKKLRDVNMQLSRLPNQEI